MIETIQSQGMIDIGLCANVVAKNMADYVLPLGIALAIMIVGVAIFAVLWGTAWQDNQLMKDYFRRNRLLNDFENWKHDRRIQ